ncbi:hypothetical protein [Priestia taiwanensis]|uniref:Uncharacterized protein n=1 Tax=Priestia taiwanensis TaxID=1347902 RepID=A0A917AVY0_9BACI|nr:hypothetical protein [Priestia taiwanensis]MBM7364824.1 hypothetical protein [Priestia taiwanensis]GGE79963.1 hypothetical protein GCM10007140_31900 [Priestia taiwanensis]
MKKKYWIIGIIATLLLVSGVAYGVYVYQNASIQIMIVNKTDKPIDRLEIQLSPGVTFRTLPTVNVGEEVEETVDPSDSNVKMRDKVWIAHTSKSGSEIALGYIETAYRGKLEVVIHKLEENETEVAMTKLGVKLW